MFILSPVEGIYSSLHQNLRRPFCVHRAPLRQPRHSHLSTHITKLNSPLFTYTWTFIFLPLHCSHPSHLVVRYATPVPWKPKKANCYATPWALRFSEFTGHVSHIEWPNGMDGCDDVNKKMVHILVNGRVQFNHMDGQTRATWLVRRNDDHIKNDP